MFTTRGENWFPYSLAWNCLSGWGFDGCFSSSRNTFNVILLTHLLIKHQKRLTNDLQEIQDEFSWADVEHNKAFLSLQEPRAIYLLVYLHYIIKFSPDVIKWGKEIRRMDSGQEQFSVFLLLSCRTIDKTDDKTLLSCYPSLFNLILSLLLHDVSIKKNVNKKKLKTWVWKYLSMT